MPDRLTDKDELTTGPQGTSDWIHLVDVSDTSSNALGTSKKQHPLNFLKGLSFVPILGAMVLKASGNEDLTIFQNGDKVIYLTESPDRFVVGIAKADVSNISQIDVSDDFKKFYDGDSLMP